MKSFGTKSWITLLTTLTLTAAACGSSGPNPNPNPNPPNPPVPLTLDFGTPLSMDAGAGVPSSAQTVYIGDFNNDGKLDFAILNNSSLGVFLGNGDGTFGARLDATSLVNGPVALAAGEFEGVQPMELVATYPGAKQLVLFFDLDQDGLFTGDAPIPAGLAAETPNGITVADFTGDGIDDIIVTNSDDGSLSYKVNMGGAAFTTFSKSSGGKLNSPRNVVSADFDQDGDMDIAVANNGADFATVWFNNGDANPAFQFQPSDADNSLTMPSMYGGQGITTADLNDDGLPDLVVPSPGSKQAAVFLNQGGGAFGAATLLTAGNDPFSAAVGDFNQDGNLDIVVPNAFGVDGANGDFGIYLGDGTGAFEAAQFFTAGTDGAAQPNHPRSVAVGDFNGDGLPDILLASDLVDQATVVLNTSF